MKLFSCKKFLSSFLFKGKTENIKRENNAQT